MRSWLVLALVTAAAEPALAGPCRPSVLEPDVLTPTGAKIGVGGGVLVATRDGYGAPEPGDASVQPAWRWNLGGTLAEPTRTTVAPGLTVYALPAGQTAATLEDAQHARKAEVVLAPRDTEVLAAPRPRAARVVTTARSSGSTPGIETHVALTLAAAPPAGAFALVTYGADGVARDWERAGLVEAKAIAIAGDAGRCEASVPGRVLSRAGDTVTFAWIDVSGRPSRMSAAITVK